VIPRKCGAEKFFAVTVSAMYSLLIQGLGPSRCGDGQKNIRLPQRLWEFTYNSL
jgi:hypothetical protein